MSTRSLTTFREFEDEPEGELVVLYRHMDGYPEGHGVELAKFLSQFKAITNGIRLDLSEGKVRTANGIGDLAGMTIAHFCNKDYPGSFYIERAGTRDVSEEYIYHVYSSRKQESDRNGTIIMECIKARIIDEPEELLYKGDPMGFLIKYDTDPDIIYKVSDGAEAVWVTAGEIYNTVTSLARNTDTNEDDIKRERYNLKILSRTELEGFIADLNRGMVSNDIITRLKHDIFDSDTKEREVWMMNPWSRTLSVMSWSEVLIHADKAVHPDERINWLISAWVAVGCECQMLLGEMIIGS